MSFIDGFIQPQEQDRVPRPAPSRDFHAVLGCAVDEVTANSFIRVDERQQTTVPGIYAAGDLARPMHNATFAMAGGVLAGAMAHHALLG